MKNLQGLLAFVETATSGSFTAAAERLEVSTAAVSKNLATLERQLGVRLLNRSTRRLAVTVEGERFLADARAALRLLDAAVAGVAQAASAPSGRVRLSVGVGFGRRWVLPALPAITAAHPALSIEADLENRPVDLVAEGYDIGIRGGVIEDSSLIARRLCALPLALVASPGYLARHGVPRAVEELAGHRCAATRLPGGAVAPWRFVAPDGARAEHAPKPQLLTSDPQTVIELALAGAGLAQTGLHHALPHLRSGALKLVMPGLHDPGSREFVMHYPHRLYLAPRVRVVVDALLAHIAGVEDLHLGVADVVKAMPGCVAAPARRRGPRPPP